MATCNCTRTHSDDDPDDALAQEVVHLPGTEATERVARECATGPGRMPPQWAGQQEADVEPTFVITTNCMATIIATAICHSF